MMVLSSIIDFLKGYRIDLQYISHAFDVDLAALPESVSVIVWLMKNHFDPFVSIPSWRSDNIFCDDTRSKCNVSITPFDHMIMVLSTFVSPINSFLSYVAFV